MEGGGVAGSAPAKTPMLSAALVFHCRYDMARFGVLAGPDPASKMSVLQYGLP